MSTYVLPQTDPSLPANASPLFSDIVANRGDHFRANNSCIWQNFLALAALFAASGSALNALNANQAGGYSVGNATGEIPVSNGTANVNLNASLLSGSTLSTDGTFAANSDTLIASQKATNTRIGHPATLFKNVDYVITDTDQAQNVNFDTTGGNRLCTLPLIANNVGRRIRVANVKGGTNILTVFPNASNANKLSLGGLASIILPKVGNYVEFQASSDTGFWEIISICITNSSNVDNASNNFGYANNVVLSGTSPGNTTQTKIYSNVKSDFIILGSIKSTNGYYYPAPFFADGVGSSLSVLAGTDGLYMQVFGCFQSQPYKFFVYYN